jgi:hypothetical protein
MEIVYRLVMTPELADSMVRGVAPFGGNVVVTPEPCSPAQLLTLWRTALQVLEEREDGEWIYFSDWHMHDGCVIPGKVVDRALVRTWGADATQLPYVEFLVYAAIHPTNLAWLWRWYISEFDSEVCLFDLTASDEVLDGFMDRLPDEVREILKVIPASEIFNPRDLS